MTIKEKEKQLGEFYLSGSVTDKNLYINTINRFINLMPSFKPLKNDSGGIDSRLEKYIVENNLKLLKTNFFAKNIPSSLRDNSYFGNRIEIAIDENNVKHIIVCRDGSREAKEISNKLGIGTIKQIYQYFVYAVGEPNSIIRELKEIKGFFESITYPYLVKTQTRNGDVSVFVFYNGYFNIEEKILNYTYSNYILTNNGDAYSNFKKQKSQYTNLQYIKDVYMKKENMITKDDFDKMIDESFEKKIKNIEKQYNLILSEIEEIKSF